MNVMVMCSITSDLTVYPGTVEFSKLVKRVYNKKGIK